MALVSPRVSPWLSEETLTPHGSDRLPVVFSLQKPDKKLNVKPQNPFRYGKSGSDVVPKLRKRKPITQNTKGSQKSKKSNHYRGTVRLRKVGQKKTCCSKMLAERENSTKPRLNAQKNNGRQNRAVQKGTTGS